MIDDNCSRVGESLYRMRSIGRNYGRASGTNDSSFTGDCDLQLTINDVPDFVIRMAMLVNPGARFNSVILERHVPGMEKTSVPAFARLFLTQSLCIDERHNGSKYNRAAT